MINSSDYCNNTHTKHKRIGFFDSYPNTSRKEISCLKIGLNTQPW